MVRCVLSSADSACTATPTAPTFVLLSSSSSVSPCVVDTLQSFISDIACSLCALSRVHHHLSCPRVCRRSWLAQPRSFACACPMMGPGQSKPALGLLAWPVFFRPRPPEARPKANASRPTITNCEFNLGLLQRRLDLSVPRKRTLIPGFGPYAISDLWGFVSLHNH
jgi:hypothetical protein